MTTPEVSGVDPSSFSAVTTPRDDLFRYVNGPWIDTYRLPDDRSRYGSFDRLAEQAENDVQAILEDEECTAVRSQALYRSFCDTRAVEKAGISPIKADLDAIDAASDKGSLTDVLGTLAPQGGPDLMDIGVYGDPGDPDTNIVHIEQGGLGLPDEAYYREGRYEPIRDAYVRMVSDQLRHAGYDDADDQAGLFLRVETRLASYHWDNVSTRDSQKTYNPTDFADLRSTLAHYDIARWANAWQRSYDSTSAAAHQPVSMLSALSRTIVHEPSFITGLDRFWRDSTLDELKLWARVHTIMGWASMLSSEFDSTNFDFFGRTLSGAREQRARWKRAVSLVNGVCGEDVGREYVSRHFPEESRARMTTLVANLIEAYRVAISGSDWLGDETKTKALEKLSKFVPKIGCTTHWRDYGALDVRADAGLIANMRAASLYESAYQLAKAGRPVDRDEWLMNPQTVNAYYEPTMNVIVFPAAILQPPFFDPHADDAANYGGIGTVIGHEIGHGFDDQGSQYDGDGRLNNWWTDEDRARFEERTRSLIAQYDSYVPQQLRERYAEDPDSMPHVNGALTIGENIGDLCGVSIALTAYAFAVDDATARPHDPSPEAIEDSLAGAPVLDGFTGAQRFFLSYASIWRTKQRDELAEQYLQIDPHSPAEFRTNGIVRNVDLFHKSFGVHPGDGMWMDPGSRVRIW